jgi:hypothetical protein
LSGEQHNSVLFDHDHEKIEITDRSNLTDRAFAKGLHKGLGLGDEKNMFQIQIRVTFNNNIIPILRMNAVSIAEPIYRINEKSTSSHAENQ